MYYYYYIPVYTVMFIYYIQLLLYEDPLASATSSRPDNYCRLPNMFAEALQTGCLTLTGLIAVLITTV